jgi:hypothetical protein
MMQDYPKLL